MAYGPAAFATAVLKMLREPGFAGVGAPAPALDPALDAAHGLARMLALFA